MRSRGFTLIEILVALVVLGLLVGGLTEGTRFGLAGWERFSHRATATAELEATERTLRNLVSGMSPGRDGDPPPLAGTLGTMEFRGATPIALGLDAGHRLVVRDVDPIPGRGMRETVLLEQLNRIEFAYWGGGWFNRWDAPEPPRLVRIRLGFAPGDARHWPDIVIAVRRERSAK